MQGGGPRSGCLQRAVAGEATGVHVSPEPDGDVPGFLEGVGAGPGVHDPAIRPRRQPGSAEPPDGGLASSETVPRDGDGASSAEGAVCTGRSLQRQPKDAADRVGADRPSGALQMGDQRGCDQTLQAVAEGLSACAQKGETGKGGYPLCLV